MAAPPMEAAVRAATVAAASVHSSAVLGIREAHRGSEKRHTCVGAASIRERRERTILLDEELVEDVDARKEAADRATRHEAPAGGFARVVADRTGSSGPYSLQAEAFGKRPTSARNHTIGADLEARVGCFVEKIGHRQNIHSCRRVRALRYQLGRPVGAAIRESRPRGHRVDVPRRRAADAWRDSRPKARDTRDCCARHAQEPAAFPRSMMRCRQVH